MLAILREISITCFFTSYLVVLVLELLRLLGRIPGRALLVIVMTGDRIVHARLLFDAASDRKSMRAEVMSACWPPGRTGRCCWRWDWRSVFGFVPAASRHDCQFLFLARRDGPDRACDRCPRTCPFHTQRSGRRLAERSRLWR